MSRRRREFPEDHEEPWSEEEWLDDMKRNDARADRFGELLETFRNDPDRDEKIAREMGWNELADEVVEAKEAGLLRPMPTVPGVDDLDEGAKGDEDDDDAPEADDDFSLDKEEDNDDEDFGGGVDECSENEPDDVRLEPDQLQHAFKAAGVDKEKDSEFGASRPSRGIAEYRLANRIGMKLMRRLKPYMQREDDPTDGRVGEAYIGPHIAAAKIVGGHSLGYEKHYINGNIARQRIGLDAVDKSLRAYAQLARDRFLPADLVDECVRDVRILRDVLAARIERMRARARRLQREE